MGKSVRLGFLLLCLASSRNAYSCFIGPSVTPQNISLASSIFVGEFTSLKLYDSYAEIEADIIRTLHGESLGKNITIYYNSIGHFATPSKHLVKQKFVVSVTTLSDLLELSPRWSESIGAASVDENSFWVIQEFCSLPHILSYNEENKNMVIEQVRIDVKNKSESVKK